MLNIVIAIVLGFQIMLNLTRPIIPLFGAGLGAGTMEIGMLTAAYALLPLLFAIHVGKIADRVGDRLPVVLGTIGMTVGVALPFALPSMWALFVSQAVVGISHIFINISLQNVLGNAAAPHNRDHYFSMLSMSVAIGGVIGPVAGGYLADHFSYSFVFMAAAAVGLLPIALAFRIPNIVMRKATAGAAGTSDTSGASASAGRESPLQLLRIPMLRKALASSALVLYSRDIFVAYFPLLALQLGLSASAIGWIITIQGIAMVSVRFFLSRLTALVGRSRILLLSILLAGLAFLFVPLTGQELALGLLSALMGAGLGFGQPLSMTTTYNASPSTRTGEVLGLRMATNRLSQMIAPLFFGLVGSWAGLASVFYISGTFLIGGAILTRPGRGDDAVSLAK
ncbi:MFS transporter [Paenibacillus sp. HJGM_3]|uniref:MFS transporter n=1 Tax=Paenibacillus sp. HJGM_3 TaxID=3379816 RepID=UPI003858617E